LAYKVSMNSAYGFCGASRCSNVPAQKEILKL
jgi:hypothetical protein